MTGRTRREVLAMAAGSLAAARGGMKEVPASKRFVVAQEPDTYLGFTGMAATREGHLVCAYLRADQHLRTTTDIMVARSEDGGRTWTGHQSISHLDIHKDGAVWVSPEINSLPGGRLVLICDRGQRRPGQDFPMLSKWQTRERGMWNYMFLSDDGGRTWGPPVQVDDVGGEPERIHQLSNGAWMFTRTQSKTTTELKNPAMPWGSNYYLSVAVFSDDQGKTWKRTATVADSPFHGDCEVGIVEIGRGHLMAITRIGDGGGAFGQPSRIVHSTDFGKTWSRPTLAPFYAQRPIPGMLPSGRVLVTYRNAWGTTASYAFVFRPTEEFTYQPNSFLWDEGRCKLAGGAMELRTGKARGEHVEFGFYPLEDDDSAAEVTAEVLVKDAAPDGCIISPGAAVRIEPHRVSLAGRAAEGFDIDATRFRRYRVLNAKGELSIFVDGSLKLKTSNKGLFHRPVRVGGRAPALSVWRHLAVRVDNRRDYSIDWKWTPRQGYPDQFRRDRIVRLERNGSFSAGHGGYSGWARLPDGTIAIADYTCGDPPKPKPFVRAYIVREEDLIP